MMKKTVKQGPISAFSSLAVFALFALCVLCVLLAGAGVYRRLVTGGQESYALRTCTQYISTRVRQAPLGAQLEVAPFGQAQALVIPEGDYLTRVYCHEGWLMELFSAREEDFAPEDGEKLIPARDLSFQLEGEVLEVALTDQYGQTSQLTFALRGGEEVAP